MEKPTKIIRKSIHTFLRNYHHFTSIATFLVFPVSASILLSQALPSSLPLLQSTHSRLQSLFDTAGFPPSSQFFSLLNIKLSQTIFSSIFTLPFTLSFLLLAKASIIQVLCCGPSSPCRHLSFYSLLHVYHPLLITHVCNCLVILSANASAFSLLFLTFNSLDVIGLSSPNILLFLSTASAVLYSVVLANTLVICNLAIVVAGMENCSGYMAILKACVLMRGRAATALSLALSTNLGFAAVEALFMYRVVRAYRQFHKFSASVAWEAVLITYIYSIFIVLDTVVGCIFYRSCKSGCPLDQESRFESQIKLVEEDDFTNSKIIQLP
ncbi:uncharacterized protein LOC131229875 [Magnolia sinica]|uniref:uncharacterized protein LOC131229875 n=1 Tax=Magnolia sinica TaxID=86752 RepID=UPI002658ED02|nr:uncharacterized protein LOC131229875 [Magnolia sinica]